MKVWSRVSVENTIEEGLAKVMHMLYDEIIKKMESQFLKMFSTRHRF